MPNNFTAAQALAAQELTKLGQAIAQTDYMITAGGAVTVNALMVLNVAAIAANTVVINSTLDANDYAGSTVTITAADATNPRRDAIYYDSTGAVGVVAGTPVAQPTYYVAATSGGAVTTAVAPIVGPALPALTATQFLLAEVYVGPNVTTITSGNIVDRRQIALKTGPALSNSTEQTTQSVSAVDMVALTFNAAITQHIRITGQYRRTAGAASACYLGLKVNATTVAEAGSGTQIAATTATSQAEDGIFVIDLFPGQANNVAGLTSFYTTKVSASGAAAVAWTAGPVALTAILPAAAVTSVTLRGNAPGGGGTTLGIRNCVVEVG